VTIGISNTRFTEMLTGPLKPGDELITRRADTCRRQEVTRSPATARPAAVIEARGLTKATATATSSPPCCTAWTCACRAASFVALMGPSGSGKSTLMNLLGLLDRADAGTLCAGRARRGGAQRQPAGRGAQPQHRLCLPELQPAQAHERAGKRGLAAAVRRHLAAATARERAQALLQQVGLGELGHRMPNQLSGGQQQRVAIARALVNQPPLLLADEPTGNLDTRTTEEVLDLLGALNREQGLTIVVVTHEADVAAHGKRLVRLKDGVMVYDGAAQRAARMNFAQLLIEAFRSLAANRLRTALTMLGIIIGIASVVLMLAVGDAVRLFIDKELSVLGSNQLIVRPGQPTEGGVRRRAGRGADADHRRRGRAEHAAHRGRRRAGAAGLLPDRLRRRQQQQHPAGHDAGDLCRAQLGDGPRRADQRHDVRSANRVIVIGQRMAAAALLQARPDRPGAAHRRPALHRDRRAGRHRAHAGRHRPGRHADRPHHRGTGAHAAAGAGALHQRCAPRTSIAWPMPNDISRTAARPPPHHRRQGRRLPGRQPGQHRRNRRQPSAPGCRWAWAWSARSRCWWAASAS
jgi:ABC-type lipoprotein export system ATPase subunit